MVNLHLTFLIAWRGRLRASVPAFRVRIVFPINSAVIPQQSFQHWKWSEMQNSQGLMYWSLIAINEEFGYIRLILSANQGVHNNNLTQPYSQLECCRCSKIFFNLSLEPCLEGHKHNQHNIYKVQSNSSVPLFIHTAIPRSVMLYSVQEHDGMLWHVIPCNDMLLHTLPGHTMP